MKCLIFVVVFVAAMRLAVRKLIGDAGPAIQTACDRMEANIPEWFPPKRMMLDLATVREQNARILELLEAERPRE